MRRDRIGPDGRIAMPAAPPILADLSPTWRRAFEWVERELGGHVCNLRRQGRWRPAWFFDLEREGELVPLYFRGDRGHAEGARVSSVLDHEANIFRVLEANGLPVPHVYGICPDPAGIVMDRCPGRFNLATLADEEERRSVFDHYIELLVKMHAIDPAEFEAHGMERLEGERALALGDFDQWVAQYRKAKRRPEPMLEFAIQWVYRNIPSGRREVTFVSADSGQFLFDEGRVTALLDMETGYLGDPLADLGGLLTRDLGEPMGPLAPAFRRYAELSGRDVDLDVVRFHGVRFNLCTPLSMAHFVAGAQPEIDFAMYQAWSIVWGRGALAGMAELLRIELPEIQPHGEQATLRAPAYDGLVHMLQQLRDEVGDDGARFYERDRPYRLALYLQRAETLGPAFDREEREEIGKLLGHSVDDLIAANAELERYVVEAGPEHDVELLRYFYRRTLREHELCRPALGDYEDRTLPPID
jgi:aminoglycoside phosphotransferase (APT) family kinase protein